SSVGAASNTANKAAFHFMARIIILDTRSMIPLKYVLAGVLAASVVSVGNAWLPASAPSVFSGATARPSRSAVREGLQPAPAPRAQDWPFYGGDQGGMKYSPLTD